MNTKRERMGLATPKGTGNKAVGMFDGIVSSPVGHKVITFDTGVDAEAVAHAQLVQQHLHVQHEQQAAMMHVQAQQQR